MLESVNCARHQLNVIDIETQNTAKRRTCQKVSNRYTYHTDRHWYVNNLPNLLLCQRRL